MLSCHTLFLSHTTVRVPTLLVWTQILQAYAACRALHSPTFSRPFIMQVKSKSPVTSCYWFHRVFHCLTRVTLPRVLRSALTTGETPWSGLVGFTFPERNQRQQLQQNLNYYRAFISCFGILSSVSTGDTNVLPQQKGEKTVSVDLSLNPQGITRFSRETLHDAPKLYKGSFMSGSHSRPIQTSSISKVLLCLQETPPSPSGHHVPAQKCEKSPGRKPSDCSSYCSSPELN